MFLGSTLLSMDKVASRGKQRRSRNISVIWPDALAPMLGAEPDQRIRSNLQRVANLLQVQATEGGLTQPHEALTDAAARLKAVAHWHTFLGRARNGDGRRTVALDTYLHAVADHFAEVFATQSRIVLLVNADPLRLPPRVAGLIGQMVNELIINAVRHAFGPKGAGIIQVGCGANADGSIALQVSDNGKGTMNGSGLGAAGTFGMQIVAALVKQLGGRLLAPKPGARVFRITLPMSGGVLSAKRKPKTVRGQA
jgi:two-component system, sensor histidine kinase PdtaS